MTTRVIITLSHTPKLGPNGPESLFGLDHSQALSSSVHVPPMSGVAIVERSDIHKSCISIESVVNILNDYCEAANAIVTIQKKLAKALRESASAKGTTEIACMYFYKAPLMF